MNFDMKKSLLAISPHPLSEGYLLLFFVHHETKGATH